MLCQFTLGIGKSQWILGIGGGCLHFCVLKPKLLVDTQSIITSEEEMERTEKFSLLFKGSLLLEKKKKKKKKRGVTINSVNGLGMGGI